jgi:hypothetical protein
MMKPMVIRNMALNNIGEDRITIVNGAVGNGGDPVEYEPHVFSFLGKFTNENIWHHDLKLSAKQIVLDQYFAKKGVVPDLLKIRRRPRNGRPARNAANPQSNEATHAAGGSSSFD